MRENCYYITKYFINFISEKLADLKFNKEIKQAQLDCENFSNFLIEKYISRNIKKMIKTGAARKYLKRGTVLKFALENKPDFHFEIPADKIFVPELNEIIVSQEDWDNYYNLFEKRNKINILRDEYIKSLRNELMELKTIESIEEHFPECIEYITYSKTSMKRIRKRKRNKK